MIIPMYTLLDLIDNLYRPEALWLRRITISTLFETVESKNYLRYGQYH